MKNSILGISTILCAAQFGGCTPYPLPQDYSGFQTYQIVINMRCEARDGLREAVVTTFERYGDKLVFMSPNRIRMTGTQAAEYFRTDMDRFEAFEIDKVVIGEARSPFRYYKNSQIAYDFSLAGQEVNSQGFDVGLTRRFGLRRDSLGFANTALSDRKVARGFLTWDIFGTLIRAPNKYCSDGKKVNIVYPITGKLPIKDLIMSYILENDLGTLRIANPNSLKAIEKAPTVPQMADTITFRTRLDANITPSISYNPTAMGFQFASLGLTNNNMREDIHRVVVAVSTAEVNVPKKFRPDNRYPSTAINRSQFMTAEDAIDVQNNRRSRDALIDISDSLSRMAN